MDNSVTLYIVTWVVTAVVLCVLYDMLFPKKQLIHKTTGYLEDNHWIHYNDPPTENMNLGWYRVTYRFSIDGKEYKKTFRILGQGKPEINILYNKGYSDAMPENVKRNDNRVNIKLLLCAVLAPILGRMILKLLGLL